MRAPRKHAGGIGRRLRSNDSKRRASQACEMAILFQLLQSELSVNDGKLTLMPKVSRDQMDAALLVGGFDLLDDHHQVRRGAFRNLVRPIGQGEPFEGPGFLRAPSTAWLLHG